MGIAYRSGNSTGPSISVWVGEVTDDQRREHMAALSADADWGAGGVVLTDLTGVSSAHRPSAKQVLDAADARVTIEELREDLRTADAPAGTPPT